MNEKEGAWELKITPQVMNFEVAGAETSWYLGALRAYSTAVNEKEGAWQLKIALKVKHFDVAGAEASLVPGCIQGPQYCCE